PEPRVDLTELGPAAERPAVLEAQADERSLGEDDVGIPGGVAVALAIADEDDCSAGGLMGKNPVPLACAAHEALRVAIWKRDRSAAFGKGRLGSDDRHARQAERRQC